MCDRQSFVNDCEKMQTWDCVYSIDPGQREASPESGDRLAIPDVVGALFRDGGQIPDHSDSDSCHSVMCTLQPDPGDDYVSAVAVRHQNPSNSVSDGCHRVKLCTLQPDPGGDYVSVLADRPVFARFLMFIVALLQSVLFGRSHQKFAPGSWCHRMSVSSVAWVVGSVMLVSALSVRLVFARSTILMFIVALLQSVWFGRSCQKFAPGSWCRPAEVCVTGSCAGPSGGPSFGIRVVLCRFVAARVQFDPGGPKFVTARASRTPVSAQPQLDVIQ